MHPSRHSDQARGLGTYSTLQIVFAIEDASDPLSTATHAALVALLDYVERRLTHAVRWSGQMRIDRWDTEAGHWLDVWADHAGMAQEARIQGEV